MEEEMPEDEELPELGDDMTDLMGGKDGRNPSTGS